MLHICRLSWREWFVRGESAGFIGEASAVIETEAGDTVTLFWFELRGDPATFDAQLDVALAQHGWRRTSEVAAWWKQCTEWDHSSAVSRCDVVRDSSIGIVTITPDVAAEMLTRYKRPPWRPESARTMVERMRDDMLAGRWQLAPDPIRRYPDGTYTDGRLRLMALVEAGKIRPDVSIQMLVLPIPEDA
jgi:hypothetical protein